MLKIYTANIKYPKVDRLDITIKSGDKTFSPTWDILIKIKSGEMSREEYKKKYIELMKLSLRENNSRWKEIISRDRIVFVCYCPAGVFCHRVLLARMFEAGGAGIYLGEIREWSEM